MIIQLDREKIGQSYNRNRALETEIERLNEQIKQNNKQLIQDFFPYLLAIYATWRPRLGEIAMLIDWEYCFCFEVIIRTVDGHFVRAQEGEKRVFHRFELDPKLEEYVQPSFIIPKANFEADIKDYFELDFLRP